MADRVGSKHLRLLLEAGIVADERRHEDARVRIFRLRHEAVAAVRAWLDQIQAHWVTPVEDQERPSAEVIAVQVGDPFPRPDAG